MFTGIVTDCGTVRSILHSGDYRLEFTTGYDTDSLALGASICCSGICLTVIDKGRDWFAVSASRETLSRTTIASWREARPVNFERALKVGDELGGHFVWGHVDGVGTIVSVEDDGASRRFTFQSPRELMRFIAIKGSIAVDGVSLTVNEVADNRFTINVIPHTLAVTTFGQARAGDRVNLEIDMVARYVARLLEKD
ncbi:MAG: riboflavin synthase [Hyphomicrobium sp.]